MGDEVYMGPYIGVDMGSEAHAHPPKLVALDVLRWTTSIIAHVRLVAGVELQRGGKKDKSKGAFSALNSEGSGRIPVARR
jgi:hypothetical protein